MKVVITGGSGYIGSILAGALIRDGFKVTVLDNFLYKQNTLAPLCLHPDFDIYRVDCRDPTAVEKHTRSADIVIPLAALVGVPICDLNPVDAELINLKAPLALFDSLSKDQLCIMPTTESQYGSNAEICTEETPLNPLSTYARHKVIVEQALLQRENSISLRLATVFGMSPRMRIDLLINDFVWRAMRDRALVVFEGQFNRTSVHVTDVARAFIHAIDTLEVGQIYNVGAVVHTKVSLCEEIKKQVPYFTYVEAPVFTDPDQRNYIVSDDKIRKTGFQPKISLDTGIAELLKGYRMLTNNIHGNV